MRSSPGPLCDCRAGSGGTGRSLQSAKCRCTCCGHLQALVSCPLRPSCTRGVSKMIRGNAWVYVLVLIALTPVFGRELHLAASAADIKALRTAHDSTEVEFVLTMSALFSIVDLKYSQKVL